MLNQLTFTRFIAAFSIVIFHFSHLAFPFDIPFLKTVMSKANLGVSYFFILSGFVMLIANGKKDGPVNVIQYYINRFGRIYPVYIFTVFLTFLIIYIGSNKQDYIALFLNIFLIQAWIPKFALSLNIPGWTLSVEFFFYLLFPYLFNLIYRRFKLSQISIGIISFWILSQLLTNYLSYSSFYEGFPSESHNFLFYYPLNHLNEFLIGNLAAIFFLKINRFHIKGIYLLLIFILIIATFYFPIPLQLHNGLMAVLFVPFILILSYNNGKIKSILSKKIFVILGEISFSLYILQTPVSLVVFELFKRLNVTNPSIKFYFFITVLLITSFISYYLIEVPARDFIKKWIKNKNISAKVAPAN